MRRSKTQWRRTMEVALPLLLLNCIAFGQTKEIEITVNDPRPLAAAIDKLEELSGIPINYEDMPVYYEADQKDVTDTVARRPPPAGYRIIVARGGQLTVPILVDATTGKLNDSEAVKEALFTVISAYSANNFPGGFDVEFYNGVFFVKPVRYRDEAGATLTKRAVLSAPITFPEEKRTISQTLRLILDQISKASRAEIRRGTGSDGMGELTMGAQSEPANHVVARFLAPRSAPSVASNGTNWDGGLSYRLLFEPKLGYALNVHRVPNSPRWAVPPSKPYTPPTPRPRTEGPGAGAIEAR
ncbi:MAG: hypothetical protein HY313_01895 [Acidobacteria bacterium]|nr:hypothetical protein [Acidobacteriota bacterium]